MVAPWLVQLLASMPGAGYPPDRVCRVEKKKQKNLRNMSASSRGGEGIKAA
jgi:hypothetical protein